MPEKMAAAIIFIRPDFATPLSKPIMAATVPAPPNHP